MLSETGLGKGTGNLRKSIFVCPTLWPATALLSGVGPFAAFIRGEFPVITRLIAYLFLLSFSDLIFADQTTVAVTISSVDSITPAITVSYDGKTRQLKLASDATIEIDGKKADYRTLFPGDNAQVSYDKELGVVTKIVVQREAMVPAEKLLEGWDEIDQRLIFLMVRLANVEASLDAINRVVDGKGTTLNSKEAAAVRAEKANEELDRKGGGPLRWSEFYGKTAESFFYHPTDRNSTYHTTTVLSQQGSQADNKLGGGVPAGQGLPVHQRPPQFDYIYRANERARDRAEAEATALRGKLDKLVARRQKLEAEQAGLWVEVAFRAILHYDLDQQPLYRYEPLMLASDTPSRERAEMIKTAATFMALSLSIISEAEKDQGATFTRIKPAIAEARESLSDTYLRLAIDVSDKRTDIGRFFALAKKIDDVAANLTDSYIVAMEGDSAKDRQRKDLFRAQLQQSLLNYAQIILAMDEMLKSIADKASYRPNTDMPIQLVGLQAIKPVATLKPIKIDEETDKLSVERQETKAVSKRPEYIPQNALFFNKKWYWFSNQQVNINDAVNIATEMNGKLIEIDSKEVNDFVRVQLKGMTYISAIKQNNGRWVDVNGKELKIFFWTKGQPDGRPGEIFLCMDREGWHDHHINPHCFFVVEWSAGRR